MPALDHVVEETLATGLRCVLVPTQMNNIVALSLFFPFGAAEETMETAGLTDISLRCMLRGTNKLTQAEFAEAVESLGSSLSFRAYRDFSALSMVCTADSLSDTLELFLQALEQPRFDPAEIEKERQTTLAAIREELDDKASFAMRLFQETLFSGSTYGIPVNGTLESVASLGISQIKDFYNSRFAWSKALLVAVGNFDTRGVLSCFERRNSLGAEMAAGSLPPPSYHKGAILEVTRNWEQAYLVMGFPACPVTHRDFFPLRVLAGVLGDGMSSRFFVQLRDQRGLAYATSCQLAAYKRGGYLAGTIGTKPQSLDDACELMLHILSEVCQNLVPDDELERTKNYIIGKYLISHQRNSAVAFYLGSYEIVGLGWRMDEEYVQRVRQVHAEDILEVARQYLHTPTIVEVRPQSPPNGG
ncbi:MAG: insulinase family protein [Candidatus Sumerlaeaceae bacterium]|nr:insulinase family protein [Candidatus Sumerlaeaceae bacterium]